MLESIIKINQAVNGFIWGVPAMICIIGVRTSAFCPYPFHSGAQIRRCPEKHDR